MNSLWNHYLPRDFSWNSLFFLRIHYRFRECTLNPLSFLRNYFELTILFTKSVWKHPLHDFTVPRINLISTISFVISLWSHYIFREFTLNTLSVSRNYYEFTICSANLLWIHYPFRDISFKSLSVSLIHY